MSFIILLNSLHLYLSTTVDVLDTIQKDSLKTLQDSFAEISPEVIAAAVNDNQRMVDKCKLLSHLSLSSLLIFPLVALSLCFFDFSLSNFSHLVSYYSLYLYL